MVNERIHNVADLERALLNAERRLKPYADDVRDDPRALIPVYVLLRWRGSRWLTSLACARTTTVCGTQTGTQPAPCIIDSTADLAFSGRLQVTAP
jgi:hypothetical protein